MKWQTDHQLGSRITTGIIVWLVLFDLLLIWIAVQLPITLATFIIGVLVLASLPIYALLAYWLIGLRGSVYTLDRNALTITWGPIQQVIPMAAIERVVPGAEITGRVRSWGGYWPGLWVGSGSVGGLGIALFYATTVSRAETLFVVTPGLVYVISPVEREKFLEAFRQRKEMGPTQDVEQTSQRPEWFDWPLWSDKLGWGMVGLATLALALLFGFLTWRFESLPAVVPLHYNLIGLADRMGPRSQIFILPLIGFLTLVANTGLGGLVHQRQERFAAYLLWAGALLVQLLLWIAVVGILK